MKTKYIRLNFIAALFKAITLSASIRFATTVDGGYALTQKSVKARPQANRYTWVQILAGICILRLLRGLTDFLQVFDGALTHQRRNWGQITV